MKKLVIALSAIVLMSGNCVKDPPFVPDDLLIQILTDGEWSITEFKYNGDDSTQKFAGWRFKYHASKSVDAKYATVVMQTGTWDGNQSAMTFSANFPSATSPVTLVNGSWNVTTPGTRVVTATQTVGSVQKTMKLYRE